MHQPDLFGEIPVTFRDVELWLYTVPRMPHYHRYRTVYARAWRVVEKIRNAKMTGKLDAIFGNECCSFCGQTLAQPQEATSMPPAAEIDALRRRLAVYELIFRPTKNPRLAGLMI